MKKFQLEREVEKKSANIRWQEIFFEQEFMISVFEKFYVTEKQRSLER